MEFDRLEKEFPSKCWYCGKEIVYKVEPLYRVFCPECREKYNAEREEKLGAATAGMNIPGM